MLAALLALLALGGDAPRLGELDPDGPFLQTLMRVNLYLLVFNLFPAFPMDGGRVLRALLASRMGLATGTRIAARFGQVCAVAAGLYGLIAGEPLLALVALFVFLGAGAEAAAVETRFAGLGLTVAQMMVTDFRTIPVHAPLSQAVALLLAGEQREFPVVDNLGRVEGMLTRDNLIRGISERGTTSTVGEAMTAQVDAVSSRLGLPGGAAAAQDERAARPARGGCGTGAWSGSSPSTTSPTCCWSGAPGPEQLPRRLAKRPALTPSIRARRTRESAGLPEARARRAGLFLRPPQPPGILHVGRQGVQHGPAFPDQRLVDETRAGPHVGQHPAEAVAGSHVELEPGRGAGREQPAQCGVCLRPGVTLGELRRIDAEQAHPAPVATGEGVPVGDPRHDARGGRRRIGWRRIRRRRGATARQSDAETHQAEQRGSVHAPTIYGEASAMAPPAHQIERTSTLTVSAEEAFAWHEREGAFERLAPPWERLDVLERSQGIGDGARTVLRVHVGPVATKWVAVHRDYIAARQFVDEQVEGPFAHWVHRHLFEPIGPDASRYTDRIEFAPPFGTLGAAAGMWLARPRAERMLAYRHETVRADLAAHRRYRDRPPLHVAITGASGLIGSALDTIPHAPAATGSHR